MLKPTDLKLLEGSNADCAIIIDDEEDENSGLTVASALAIMNLYLEEDESVESECVICREPVQLQRLLAEMDMDNPEDHTVALYSNACFHCICVTCIAKYNEQIQRQEAPTNSSVRCPECFDMISPQILAIKRSDIISDFKHRERLREHDLNQQLASYSGPHTKTISLVQKLRGLEAESALTPDLPPIKVVVFSQFLTHLDLIAMALVRENIKFTRLDGRMKLPEREEAVKMLNTDDSVRVILMSLKAGGVGLNLTSANHVFLMEPSYNPAAEDQAVDRVHRIGQKRPVYVYKMAMEDTVERQILDLQNQKRQVALLMNKESGSTKESRAERMNSMLGLFKR
jgi:SNF2 family DNA or RNA helicase